MRRTFIALGLVIVAALSGSDASAAAPGPHAEGLRVLEERGCLACHSVDGTARVGPTLLGLFGSDVPVIIGERAAVTRRVDADYIRRAILEPDAERRPEYPLSTMPIIEISDQEVEAIVAGLEHLARPEVMLDRRRDEGSLLILIIGALLFVFGHMALSSVWTRPWLIKVMGKRVFTLAYSLVASVSLGLLIWGWIVAPYVALWTPPLWTRHIPLTFMPLSFIFMTASFMTKNATVVGQDEQASEPPRGIVTVTRHPMLWGFALWGLVHVPPNGDLATVILSLSVVALSFAGMLHIDHRRAVSGGEVWKGFAAQTSVVPFVAALRRRTRLDLRGIALPAVLGLAAYAGMLFGHQLFIGVRALPY